MISLAYHEAFFYYFLLWCVLVAVLWLREERRMNRNRWRLTTRQLFHCDKCHHTFVPKETVSLCRCPRCNAICIRRRSRDLE